MGVIRFDKLCIENKNGSCRFDSDCWYKHTVVMTKDENIKEVNGMITPELKEGLLTFMKRTEGARFSSCTILQIACLAESFIFLFC